MPFWNSTGHPTTTLARRNGRTRKARVRRRAALRLAHDIVRVIPSHPSADAPRSQRDVFHALSALPNPWVLDNIPLAGSGRRARVMQQLDLLLINPQEGSAFLR